MSYPDWIQAGSGRRIREDGSIVNIADLISLINQGIYTKPADGIHLDSFGRARVSQANTLFDIVAYGIGGNATCGASINWNEQTI